MFPAFLISLSKAAASIDSTTLSFLCCTMLNTSSLASGKVRASSNFTFAPIMMFPATLCLRDRSFTSRNFTPWTMSLAHTIFDGLISTTSLIIAQFPHPSIAAATLSSVLG